MGTMSLSRKRSMIMKSKRYLVPGCSFDAMEDFGSHDPFVRPESEIFRNAPVPSVDDRDIDDGDLACLGVPHHPLDREMQGLDALQRFRPVRAQGRLAANRRDADNGKRRRTGERAIVVEMAENPFDVARVPCFRPVAGE